jgi:hypothetical protein
METEQLCDKACNDTLDTLNAESANEDTNNIFYAKFMKNFEGPVSGQLFIDRGDRSAGLCNSNRLIQSQWYKKMWKP